MAGIGRQDHCGGNQNGVNIAVSKEPAAEAPGVEIAADEKRDIVRRDEHPLPPTLYLGVEGTRVPMRPESCVRDGRRHQELQCRLDVAWMPYCDSRKRNREASLFQSEPENWRLSCTSWD
jgi:hypothetical protein